MLTLNPILSFKGLSEDPGGRWQGCGDGDDDGDGDDADAGDTCPQGSGALRCACSGGELSTARIRGGWGCQGPMTDWKVLTN